MSEVLSDAWRKEHVKKGAANDPRYDDETVTLVAQAFNRISVLRPRADEIATAILETLADAGLLLPPDVEANRQYGRRMPNGLVLTSHLPDPTHYRLNGPWKELPGD